MDKIDDLRLLTQLVAAGSLSAAARRLYSSPPAMSRRLAQMEARLGVKLIERSTRRFTLTPEGERLHERALAIVADVDAAEAEARAGLTTPQGLLRIAVPMEIGRRRLAPLIGRFQADYPGVTCEVALSDAGLDAIRDDLDIVLRTTPPMEQGVDSIELLESTRVVCASPGYLDSAGSPQAPRDLAGHACLCLVRGRRVFDRWRLVGHDQSMEVRVDGKLRSTSGEVLHQWALDGRGIALKMLWDIEDDLSTGRLVDCLPGFRGERTFLYMSHVRRQHQPLRIRRFLDFLAANVASNASPDGRRRRS